ncbi:MAG: hypothetical protein LBU84_06430 [Prevotella sp.]|jgi:hypothetical protein|nr:hypothetical protein [Prevotella sp.]
MANSNVRLAAANLLLDRGVRFTIPDAPFYWRLLRLNKIHIRPLRGGTIAEISRLIDEYQLDDVRSVNAINQKLSAISEVIAVAILNNKKAIARFTGRLAKLLLWKVPAHVLIEIFLCISGVNKVSDFTLITVFFCQQATMMMSPRNTGQTGKGS